MNEEIQQYLSELERVNSIKILFAVESGSRAWGFPSQNSDYDIRFVYVRKLPAYFQMTPSRDVIEAVQGDFDVAGWELGKALRLMYNGNFAIREWLTSPIVYISSERKNWLQELVKINPQPEKLMYSYRSLLKKCVKDYIDLDIPEIQLKKYFYAIRSAFCMQWLGMSFEKVDLQNMIPPMNLKELMLWVYKEDFAEIYDSIYRLIEQKVNATEDLKGPRISVIDKFLVEMMNTDIPMFPKSSEVEMNDIKLEYSNAWYRIVMSENNNV